MNKTCIIRPIGTHSLSLQEHAWETIEKQVLDCTNFSPGIRCPHVTARIVASADGFTVRFDSNETDPATRYSSFNDPAWLDSCVEFFFAPDGTQPDVYLNFEQSAGGALLIQKGTKSDRTNLEGSLAEFEIERDIREDGWSVKFFVPFSFLLRHFPRSDRTFRGNFQFCNEDKNFYVTWNRIENPTPQFHLPEFFGVFETDL